MGWSSMSRTLGMIGVLGFLIAAFTPFVNVLARWQATPGQVGPAVGGRVARGRGRGRGPGRPGAGGGGPPRRDSHGKWGTDAPRGGRAHQGAAPTSRGS